ncbi:MAG: hypothetical protein CSA72_08600 [Rhodobacterales bacterium]|nr:MAG: hypothetical protein CSA72_08600 [Rhodobacterales bacterium]
MDDVFVDLITTATVVISLFGATLALNQQRYPHVARSFAAFLLIVAVNNLPDIVRRALSTAQQEAFEPLLAAVGIATSLCIAPAFWLYVVMLTSTQPRIPPHPWRHAALPVLGLVAAILVAFFSRDLLFLSEAEISQDFTAWQMAILALLLLVILTMFAQLLVYLYLIMRRLLRYRRRLQDFYASTEKHELRWIYIIGGLGLLFWCAQIMSVRNEITPERQLLSQAALSLAGLAMVVATTFWGLRQRPALVPAPSEPEPAPLPDQPSGSSPEKSAEKYEKSALSPEASARIERKLRAAMETDKLHRDANLSLWSLARHVGASPNYISQTLNEVIGESFFDFVNRHRIAEAMRRLSDTDETVLTITYDVGFNSRSSFYTAFKRVTGQTPTGYRKSLSDREGADDDSEAQGHI